jgi:hypothetical protein
LTIGGSLISSSDIPEKFVAVLNEEQNSIAHSEQRRGYLAKPIFWLLFNGANYDESKLGSWGGERGGGAAC